MSTWLLDDYFDGGMLVGDPTNYNTPIAADSTPTYAVFQDTSDTPIITATNMTARSGYTGAYRFRFQLTTAAGFVEGHNYEVRGVAVVGGVTGCAVQRFRVAFPALDITANGAAELAVFFGNAGATSGLKLSDLVTLIATVNGGTLTAAGIRSAIGLASANLDTQLDALPTAAENADAAWDELRAGHVVSGSFGQGVASVQGNITGNVSGNVTGNVAGNVAGSVGSVTATVNADVKKVNGVTVSGNAAGTPMHA